MAGGFIGKSFLLPLVDYGSGPYEEGVTRIVERPGSGWYVARTIGGVCHYLAPDLYWRTSTMNPETWKVWAFYATAAKAVEALERVDAIAEGPVT